MAGAITPPFDRVARLFFGYYFYKIIITYGTFPDIAPLVSQIPRSSAMNLPPDCGRRVLQVHAGSWTPAILVLSWKKNKQFSKRINYNALTPALSNVLNGDMDTKDDKNYNMDCNSDSDNNNKKGTKEGKGVANKDDDSFRNFEQTQYQGEDQAITHYQGDPNDDSNDKANDEVMSQTDVGVTSPTSPGPGMNEQEFFNDNPTVRLLSTNTYSLLIEFGFLLQTLDEATLLISSPSSAASDTQASSINDFISSESWLIEAELALRTFGPSSPVDLKGLVANHLWVQHFKSCRLFLSPRRLSSPSSCIVRVAMENGVTYFPIGLSNIHSTLTIKEIIYMAHSNKWGDIVVISASKEADGTQRIEIGLRYIEDALLMWLRKGVFIRHKRMVIEPATSVCGNVYTCRSYSPARPFLERSLKLRFCLSVEQRLPVALHDVGRMTQIQTLIHQQGIPPPITLREEIPCLSLDALPSCIASDPSLTNDDTIGNTKSIQWYDWIDPSVTSWAVSSVSAEMLDFSSDMTLLSLLQPRAPTQVSQTGTLLRPGPKPQMQEYLTGSISVEEPVLLFRRTHKSVDPTRGSATNCHPRSARNMTKHERGKAARELGKRAESKFTAWNSHEVPLPPVPQLDRRPAAASESAKQRVRDYWHEAGVPVVMPPSGSDVDGIGLVHRFLQLWDWYDECLKCIQVVKDRLESENRLVVSLTALAPVKIRLEMLQDGIDDMELAFSAPARMISLYGKEYKEVKEAIEKRTSMFIVYW